MNKQVVSFSFVEKQVRKKTFGVLTTINRDGTPHTTGILYSVSPPSSKFALFCLTSKNYKKVRNIERNPNISFLIPFPHYYIRFAPASIVTFQGTIDFLSVDTPGLKELFSKKRILRLITKQIQSGEPENMTFLRIKPKAKVLCHGLGINIFKMRKGHSKGGYSVKIPENRLFKNT